MYGMRIRAEERVELRAPAGRKAKWLRAAARAGVSLSDWARRRLDEVAEAELGIDEPPPPSEEDVREALAAEGCLGPERAARLRSAVRAARRTPWRGRS
jgi:hypothetical protein